MDSIELKHASGHTVTSGSKCREIVKHSETEILGYTVKYRLYKLMRNMSVFYMIYAGYRHERSLRMAGTDRALAEKIFGAVVRGRVTPCSLSFIVDDLLKEEAAN